MIATRWHLRGLFREGPYWFGLVVSLSFRFVFTFILSLVVLALLHLLSSLFSLSNPCPDILVLFVGPPSSLVVSELRCARLLPP